MSLRSPEPEGTQNFESDSSLYIPGKFNVTFFYLIALVIGFIILGAVIAYIIAPLPFFELLMKIAGRAKGLRWRVYKGWPVIEGGSPSTPEEPIVVLIHGFGVDKQTMFGLARELTARHRIHAIDLPGFGEHHIDDPTKMDINAFTAAVHSYLDLRELDRVVLVGSSMGGAISAAYAIRYPERIAGLCLIGPAGLKPPIETELFKMGLREENGLRVDSVESFDRIFDMNFSHPPPMPEKLKLALVEDATKRADHHEEILRAMGETLMDGLREDIKKIVCPVSIVWGDEDQIIHPSVASHWEEELSNVEMNIMPNAGHSTQMEFPREVAEVIDRLMANIERSA